MRYKHRHPLILEWRRGVGGGGGGGVLTRHPTMDLSYTF